MLFNQRLNECSKALDVPLHLPLLLLVCQVPADTSNKFHLFPLEELLLILRLERLNHNLRNRLVPEVVHELRQLRSNDLDHLCKEVVTSSERW